MTLKPQRESREKGKEELEKGQGCSAKGRHSYADSQPALPGWAPPLMQENATLCVQLAGNHRWIPFPILKVCMYPGSIWPGLLIPAGTTAVGSWMLPGLVGDSCSPLILVSRPREEVWICPSLHSMSLKEVLTPVWIAPALDITVLPQGNISGCSLEAMPTSLLALTNSALLLSS